MQRGRLVFIDALRLIAAVQMIQGHSVASVLGPAYREGGGFTAWTFARGLTSIIFLTTAGLSFVLAEERAPDPNARRRRTRRALWLVGLGYLMHAPFAVLVGAPRGPALRAFAAVDVLQCIGVSLLVLELLTRVCANRGGRALLALGLGLACFLSAPAADAIVLSGAALPVGNYLTARYGSLFPLVPWAGNVLLGFGVGTLAFPRSPALASKRAVEGASETAPKRAPALASAALSKRGPALASEMILGGSGLLGVAAGALGLWLGPALPRALSPAYCALKLGLVLTLAALLALALRRVERLPATLAALASETLFLYVSHVVILYADGVGLAWQLGEGHGPGTGVLLALVLLVSCSAAALMFRALRAGVHGGTSRGARERA